MKLTSDEMKRALELFVGCARTGMLCVSAEEMKLMREYIRTMSEWEEK